MQVTYDIPIEPHFQLVHEHLSVIEAKVDALAVPPPEPCPTPPPGAVAVPFDEAAFSQNYYQTPNAANFWLTEQAGRYCRGVYIKRDDPYISSGNRPRAEVEPVLGTKFVMGETVRYTFDTLIASPEDFNTISADTVSPPEHYETGLFQWHNSSGSTASQVGAGVPLWVFVWDNRVNIKHAESNGSGGIINTRFLPDGGLIFAYNTWLTWVFEVKWETNATGFVKVWLNGTQVVDFVGQTTWPDNLAPYMKWGLNQGAFSAFKTDYFRAYYANITMERLL